MDGYAARGGVQSALAPHSLVFARIYLYPQKFQIAQNRRTHHERMLADATGETNRVQTAHLDDEGPQPIARRRRQHVERQLAALLTARGTLLDVAHVVVAADPQQPALVGTLLQHLSKGAPFVSHHQIQRVGVEVADAIVLRQPALWAQPMRSPLRDPGYDRAERR